MVVALDHSGKLISIDDIKPAMHYICPMCKGEVYVSKERLYATQFKHLHIRQTDKHELVDTKWTASWKKQVPISNREVVIEHDGVSHKADIQIGEYVILLSNYIITRKEFNYKTEFFSSAGYKVIWIFNMTDFIKYRKIKVEDTGNANPIIINWYWTYPRNFLQDFNPRNKDGITVLFQMGEEQFDNPNAIYLHKINYLNLAKGREILRRFQTMCIPQNKQVLFKMIEEKEL